MAVLLFQHFLGQPSILHQVAVFLLDLFVLSPPCLTLPLGLGHPALQVLLFFLLLLVLLLLVLEFVLIYLLDILNLISELLYLSDGVLCSVFHLVVDCLGYVLDLLVLCCVLMVQCLIRMLQCLLLHPTLVQLLSESTVLFL